MKKILKQLLTVLLLSGMLVSCNKDKAKKDEVNPSPATLYNMGMDEMKAENYAKAAENFGKLIQEYPYTDLAVKAQLMEAYAYYKKHDYDMAIPALDGFMKLHPSHKDIPYALFLKGLSYYEQITNIERDQSITEEALSVAKELIARYPDSKYAKDFRLKLDLIYDHLAGKEMEIGRFYIHKGELLAAINRFNTVVEKFQSTSHVAEALYRLTEAYISLGIIEEAKKNAAVLGHNYPGSKWYKDSYELINRSAQSK